MAVLLHPHVNLDSSLILIISSVKIVLSGTTKLNMATHNVNNVLTNQLTHITYHSIRQTYSVQSAIIIAVLFILMNIDDSYVQVNG